MVMVISPPGFTDRFHFVAQQLKELQLPFQRAHVEVANEHSRRDICLTNTAHTAVLVNGTYVRRTPDVPGMPERMISLLYNHVDVWDRTAKQKHLVLVLEDDVNISTTFKPQLRQAMWDLRNQPWDILWPGYCCCTPDGAPVTPTIARHRKTGCTQSYLLHPGSAARMLKAMPTKDCAGSDHYMNRLFENIPCWKGYATRSNLIIQDKRAFPMSTHRHPREEVVTW